MNTIVMLSGSPSAESRSEKLLRYLGDQLTELGYSVKMISVRDIPARVLFDADYKAKEIQSVTADLADADGVIVCSPVYKVSYTGVMKALIDLLPRTIFQYKPVLPVMVGGTEKHFMALDFALKPLIAFMKGEALQGLYLLEGQLDVTNDLPVTDLELRQRIKAQLQLLTEKATHHG